MSGRLIELSTMARLLIRVQ